MLVSFFFLGGDMTLARSSAGPHSSRANTAPKPMKRPLLPVPSCNPVECCQGEDFVPQPNPSARRRLPGTAGSTVLQKIVFASLYSRVCSVQGSFIASRLTGVGSGLPLPIDISM